jgi:hypothetical protein
MGKHNIPLDQKLLNRCEFDPVSGCWNWTGFIKNSGYGSFTARKKGKTVTKTVHRWAYEVFIGPIEEGAIIRHSCDNKLCINPSHLETGTQKDNMQDRLTRTWRPITHCINGHELKSPNLVSVKRKRCKICAYERRDKWYETKGKFQYRKWQNADGSPKKA